MAILHKPRGTRPAPSTSRTPVNEGSNSPQTTGRKLSEREHLKASAHHETFTDLVSNRPRAPVNTPEWPLATAQTEPVAPWTADSSIEQSTANQSLRSTRSSHPRELSAQTAVYSFSKASFDDPTANVMPEVLQLARGSISSSYDNPPNQPWHLPEPAIAGPPIAVADTTNPTTMPPENTMRGEQNCLRVIPHAASPLVRPIQSNAPALEPSPNGNVPAANRTGVQRPVRPPSLLFDHRKALSTYSEASSSIGSQLSPHYLSQPESPSVRDFEEAWELASLARPASLGSDHGSPRPADRVANRASSNLVNVPEFPRPGFQGYSIAEPQHASSRTRRTPASAIFSPEQALSSNDPLAQPWNDASGHGLTTALDELIDDLGYLGTLIV
ncbi:MAG: hypothetical protein Q9211_005956 [Gyalolechia sp. 1 TL-2023]